MTDSHDWTDLALVARSCDRAWRSGDDQSARDLCRSEKYLEYMAVSLGHDAAAIVELFRASVELASTEDDRDAVIVGIMHDVAGNPELLRQVVGRLLRSGFPAAGSWHRDWATERGRQESAGSEHSGR